MIMNQEIFRNILSAMNSGAGHWASIEGYSFDPDTGTGKVKFFELDEGGWPEDTHELSSDAFLNVLTKLDEYRLAEDIKDVLARHEDEDFLIHVDAEVADCWLQLATFGELVYG